MSIAALRDQAQGLPGATVDIKWGADWVASVGSKMFFVTANVPQPKSASFKVDDHRFLELTGMPGFAPAPYLARVKWAQLSDAKVLPLAELKALVARSHALVVAKLPKRLQKELGA